MAPLTVDANELVVVEQDIVFIACDRRIGKPAFLDAPRPLALDDFTRVDKRGSAAAQAYVNLAHREQLELGDESSFDRLRMTRYRLRMTP